LELADAIAGLAAYAAEEGPASAAAVVPAPRRYGKWAQMWLEQVTRAAFITTRLLRYVLPHCADGPQRLRVLAAAGLLLQAGPLCQRLAWRNAPPPRRICDACRGISGRVVSQQA
jgi:predicted phage tail protein